MLLVTPAVKVRQLGHNAARNAGSILATGVLNGGTFGVRCEGENEHSPSGLSRHLERGGQRSDAEVGR